ncbi:hypothetical protein FISHEDRAFT_59195 [Fistulina hepatica ATCC 64428]|uniref:Uncharacterized protein n=1 Tax=Fistulina hepatica ATCC 64428 TaxID=1128425 RepID=A0A0D7ADX0_9AGAR|nr:hypothetical protein FISHEDRAFT_59195 [Fistulina hepatica ATCC 64428]
MAPYKKARLDIWDGSMRAFPDNEGRPQWTDEDILRWQMYTSPQGCHYLECLGGKLEPQDYASFAFGYAPGTATFNDEDLESVPAPHLIDPRKLTLPPFHEELSFNGPSTSSQGASQASWVRVSLACSPSAPLPVRSSMTRTSKKPIPSSIPRAKREEIARYGRQKERKHRESVDLWKYLNDTSEDYYDETQYDPAIHGKPNPLMMAGPANPGPEFTTEELIAGAYGSQGGSFPPVQQPPVGPSPEKRSQAPSTVCNQDPVNSFMVASVAASEGLATGNPSDSMEVEWTDRPKVRLRRSARLSAASTGAQSTAPGIPGPSTIPAPSASVVLPPPARSVVPVPPTAFAIPFPPAVSAPSMVSTTPFPSATPASSAASTASVFGTAAMDTEPAPSVFGTPPSSTFNPASTSAFSAAISGGLPRTPLSSSTQTPSASGMMNNINIVSAPAQPMQTDEPAAAQPDDAMCVDDGAEQQPTGGFHSSSQQPGPSQASVFPVSNGFSPSEALPSSQPSKMQQQPAETSPTFDPASFFSQFQQSSSVPSSSKRPNRPISAQTPLPQQPTLQMQKQPAETSPAFEPASFFSQFQQSSPVPSSSKPPNHPISVQAPLPQQPVPAEIAPPNIPEQAIPSTVPGSFPPQEPSSSSCLGSTGVATGPVSNVQPSLPETGFPSYSQPQRPLTATLDERRRQYRCRASYTTLRCTSPLRYTSPYTGPSPPVNRQHSRVYESRTELQSRRVERVAENPAGDASTDRSRSRVPRNFQPRINQEDHWNFWEQRPSPASQPNTLYYQPSFVPAFNNALPPNPPDHVGRFADRDAQPPWTYDLEHESTARLASLAPESPPPRAIRRVCGCLGLQPEADACTP